MVKVNLCLVVITTLMACIANSAHAQGLSCDLDADGDCDHGDIDLLYSSSPTPSAISEWLEAASGASNPYKANVNDVFVLGDTNLSGEVTSTDLGLLLNHFGVTGGITWDQGDMNGADGVDSTDLGLLLNNFGFTSASVISVPEPRSITLAWLLGIPLIFQQYGRGLALRSPARQFRPND